MSTRSGERADRAARPGDNGWGGSYVRPMGEIGADPTSLRRTASTMRAASRELHDSRRRMTGLVHRSSWRGRDADGFRSRWKRSSGDLGNAAEMLDGLASELERNADEQLVASSSVAGLGLTGSAPGPSTRPTDRAEDGSLADRIPHRIETYRLTGAGSAGLGLKGERQVTVEYLPTGRAVVWVETAGGLTASGGLGGGIGAEGLAGIALGADGTAELVAMERRGWLIDDDEIAAFIGKGLLQELVEATEGGPLYAGAPSTGDLPLVGDFLQRNDIDSPLTPIGLLAAPISFLGHKTLDLVGLGIDDPDFTEESLTLGGALEATGDLGIVTAGAGLGFATTAAISRGPSGDSLKVTFGAEGGARAAVDGRSASGETTVEVPLGDNEEALVSMTTTTHVGDHASIAMSTYDPDRLDLASVLHDVANGDLTSAAEGVGAMLDELNDPIESVSIDGHVDSQVVEDVGGEVSAGPSFEVRVGGGRVVTTFDR